MTSSHTPRLPIQAPEGIKSPVATATIEDTDLQGLQTINGYQLNVNDRVLVMNQVEPAQNGIYSAQQGRWTRTQDWKVGFQIANGVLVLDINTGVLWRASFAGVLKVDATPVTFTAVVSGAGSLKFIQEDLPINNVEDGDEWYKPSEATTYIYYVDEDGGQWVEQSVQSAEGTLRDEIGIPVNTVADLKLVDASIGSKITTKGYYTAFDGGDAEYVVVKGGTGVEDGGVYHYLSNGNQAKLLSERTTARFGCVGSGDKQPQWANFVASGGGKIDSDFEIASFPVISAEGGFTASLCPTNLVIEGVGGSITSAGGSSTLSIIRLDSTSPNADITIKGVNLKGNSRFRLYSSEATATCARECVTDCRTEMQSIISNATSKEKVFKRNVLGYAVTAATAHSPQLAISTPSPEHTDLYEVMENTVRTGTEAVSGAFFVKNIPAGGKYTHNTNINIGKGGTEGFDVDGVGQMAIFSKNSAIFSPIEIKTGASYELHKECLVSNNVVYECEWTTGFSIRGSGIYTDNLNYNSTGWGLFMSEWKGNAELSGAIIKGFRYIYAGVSGFLGSLRSAPDAGVVMKNIVFEDFQSIVDATYLNDNPTFSHGVAHVDIDGDFENLTFNRLRLSETTQDHMVIRGGVGGADGFFVNKPLFDDTAETLIDISGVENVVIDIDKFPTIGDRPFRLTGCTRVRVDCPFSSLTLASTPSLTDGGYILNGTGFFDAGAGNPPQDAHLFPIGITAINTSDGTAWIRKTGSTSPAAAWTQVG